MLLIKAIDGTLKRINHNVEINGNAQEALNQLLRIKSIHKVIRQVMLNKERVCEENNQYVIDWGDGDVFPPDANVVFNIILDVKAILKDKMINKNN